MLDAEHGAIVIDDGVKLGHFSMLRGPVYVGPHSRISEYAAIKDEVSISHTCKIGGEVEATVIEPYSNKQHHGFLGHSYLGQLDQPGGGYLQQRLEKYLRRSQCRVRRSQGRNRHAVSWLRDGGLRQNGDQHQHLHRATDWHRQHGLRVCDHECAQFCQLCAIVWRAGGTCHRK